MIIKATCPTCADVDLRYPDVVVHVIETLHGNRCMVSFVCPICRALVEKPIDSAQFKLLNEARLVQVVQLLPAEAREPHKGPPICEDDYLDLINELSSDSFVP